MNLLVAILLPEIMYRLDVLLDALPGAMLVMIDFDFNMHKD